MFDDSNIANPLEIPTGLIYAGRNDVEMPLAKHPNGGLYLIESEKRHLYLARDETAFADYATLAVLNCENLEFLVDELVKNDPKTMADPDGFWPTLIEEWAGQ